MLLTFWAESSTPSSASSAEALAPVSIQSPSAFRYHPMKSTKQKHTDIDCANFDHSTVSLVGNAIDLLQLEGVGQELVLGLGKSVLYETGY